MMYQHCISQADFAKYTDALETIRVYEECCVEGRLDRLRLDEDERFIKVYDQEVNSLQNQPLFPFPSSPIDEKARNEVLKSKVTFINDIHNRIEQSGLQERSSDDCAALAARSYKTCIKTIAVWNQNHANQALMDIECQIKELPENINPSAYLAKKTQDQIADEQALNLYFDWLERYPKLKRTGDLNDHTKGAYEIIYDEKEIEAVRQAMYTRQLNKALQEKLSPSEARARALDFSRIGVVKRDGFWSWIRDAVISPSGYKHTYNRIVQLSDLSRTGGVVAFPIIEEDGVKKVPLILTFRHAINSWALELPRGGTTANDKSDDVASAEGYAAIRETKEETGFMMDPKETTTTAKTTPDSGLVSSVIPIVSGPVTDKGIPKPEKTEAIKGTYVFTIEELKKGIKEGQLTVEIDGELKSIPVIDPFLNTALLMFILQSESN